MSIKDSNPNDTGLIVLVIPKIKNILKILEPTTLPIAISDSPFLEAITLVTNSGKLVPIATTVKAITLSLTLNNLAIVVALFTTNCPPIIIPTIPIIIKNIFI